MAHDITFRRMQFTFPDDLDPLTCAGGPEESCFNIALSCLLPYLEPYLIRSLNAARAAVDDPELLADIDKFNQQEGQHYRQHKQWNEVMHTKGFPRLADLERELDADYRRFTDTKSLAFNLAYAEGFEAMTMNVARFTLAADLTKNYHPVVRDLFLWHLSEELEHRTVAFDVYARAGRGYLYRLVVGTFAQWHMLQWVIRTMLHLLSSRARERKEQHGGWWGTVKRMVPLVIDQLLYVTPKVMWSATPFYSPHRIPMPERARALAAHYSSIALPPLT